MLSAQSTRWDHGGVGGRNGGNTLPITLSKSSNVGADYIKAVQ